MLGYKNINRDINRHVDDEDILTYKQVQERGGTENATPKNSTPNKLD